MLLSTTSTPRIHALRRATRRAGFTLLEVLVVVAILVILAGVASISIFRYMEDAKVGRAKADMQAIEKACKTFYTQHNEWPDPSNLAITIGPLLEQGQNALIDPWGNPYNVQVGEVPQPDGSSIQRVLITCQPPGKPAIEYPEMSKGR
jgi:general secretion pathway protein G